MTSLGVSHVFVQDGTAWCQVESRNGVLRVGNQLTRVVRQDGTIVEVGLIVQSIELASGQVMELQPTMSGRIRLVGTGIEAIQPWSLLENAAQWQYVPDGRPPMPGPTQGSTLDESERPRLLVTEAPDLSRVSTAFRLVLVIPQVIVLWALSVAAEFVVFLGWFAALATGRLPEWAGEFLANYLQYQARVYGYFYLLTDEYPPFALTPVSYPVHLELPQRGRLNRWSVLFRIFLLLPVYLVSILATLGWGVASLVIWLVVLVKGRFPTPLFQSTVAVLRFALRTTAYAFMLTSRYPQGLFGDQPADTPAASTAEPSDRVVLSTGAKSLVVTFLVLGVLGYAGYVAALVAAANAPTSASSISPTLASTRVGSLSQTEQHGRR